MVKILTGFFTRTLILQQTKLAPRKAKAKAIDKLISPQHFWSSLSGMAWRCSGTSNTELINKMWDNGLITNADAKAAFLSVDRGHYCPHSPYDDSPAPIGWGATISAPHMHASAVEHLLPFIQPTADHPHPRVLDIGSGSGYLTHILASLAGPHAKVVGIEHIKELSMLGVKNMARSAAGKDMLDNGRVRFVVGDGRKGWDDPEVRSQDPEAKKWDAIHVGAGARELHQELIDQLRSPGRLFIPVEDPSSGWQSIWVVDKKEDGSVVKKKLFGVRYIPLTDPEEQLAI